MLRILIVFLIVSFGTTGCGLNENKGILMAAGSYSDLAVVVSDPQFRPAANRFLEAFREKKIFVIKEEPVFKADVYDPDNWDLAKGYKNILFLVRLGDGGATEKAVRRIVSAESLTRLGSGGGGIVQVNDPWSTYQLAVVVASPDRNSLGSVLQQNVRRLRQIFADSSRERILRHYRYEGLQTDLMNDYWQRFGFVLEIPGEFTQNQLMPDGFGGLELLTGAPSRGITITWKTVENPGELLTDNEALAALRTSMAKRMHSEEVLPETFVWSEAEIGGHVVRKLEGAWNSTRFNGGGAFWCYFIPDPDRGRIFCLDLLAYAPGMDKMVYFRRLDAIASTFSLTRPRP